MRNFYTTLFAALIMVAGFSVVAAGGEARAQPAVPGSSEEPTYSEENERDFARGKIIVKLEEDATQRGLRELNRENDARTEEDLPRSDLNVVDLPSDTTVQEGIEDYEDSTDVEYAEPDFIFEPTATPDDTFYEEYMYGLNNTGQTGGTPDADINAPEAWDVTTGGPDTLVAVIDEGVDVDHPDIDDNLWVNEDEIPGNGIDDDNNGYVDDVNGWDFANDDNTVYDPDPVTGEGDEHGTHVAGTIAAEGDNGRGVTGVNWQADLMVLKFLGTNGGFTSDAVEAINYAVDNGAPIWGGGGESQALQEAIAGAGSEGHLFVAAAGNADNDNDATPFYPASYTNSNIISVAATDDDDNLASFSNYGEESVDLGAPGVGIASTVPGGYARYNGTSMASPHVAGIAGLLKSAEPGLGGVQLKDRILGSAEATPALQGNTVTGARANAAGALGVNATSATDISLSIGSSTLVFGQGTNLFGGLKDSSGDPIADKQVVMLQRPVDADRFSRVPDGTVTTDSNGRFVVRGVKPEKNTVYRARFAGDEAAGLDPSVSAPEVINVRVRLTLNVAKDQLRTGEAQGIAGRVLPDHTGEARLKILRDGSRFDVRWISLEDSIFRYNFRPSEPGTYRVSVVFPRDDDHLGNRGPIRRFEVNR
jgi:subtilisin family serine protease